MGQADVKEYTQRAAELRSEGRLEESILAARKATTMDANNANAWWQLALTLDEKDGGDAALSALTKVTELAPNFAVGWSELARKHYFAGRRVEALEAYENALEADPSHIASMRMVAYLLKDSEDDGVAERRISLLRAVFEKGELNEEDTFDLAYLLGEAGEIAEAAKVYEHFTANAAGMAAFYNLALCYRKVGRNADALDAIEAAIANGFETDQLKMVKAALKRQLIALRERALLRPQPLLPQASWFRHYINPFTLLNVEPEDVAENPKALLKAKQALLREIELEDGNVAWLPGLNIDKSTAMARVAELDNSKSLQAHGEVFHNRALNEFLMRGDLQHFLIEEDGATHNTLPHLLDADLLEFIGPTFSAQFDEVLSRAVEQADLTVVETLLSGRRWVTPAQQEACFHSTRRLLSRLSEPMMHVADEAENRAVTRREIEQAFNHGKLGELLPLLPIEFYEVHSSVGNALRGLAVSFYNHEQDAEGAKAILSLGHACAQKSPALAHLIAADIKTLDGFLAEERSKEAHLTFKGEEFSITKAGVGYGKQKLATADITGIRWGLTQTYSNPATYRLTVAFQARHGGDIEMSWSATTNIEDQKKHLSNLVDATNSFIMSTVIENFQAELNRSQTIRVGPVLVSSSGVELTAKGWFSDKKVMVPWRRLSSTLANGSVVLRDIQNQKASADLPIETTYNAFLLHILVNGKEQATS